MANTRTFEELLAQARSDDAYWQEWLVGDFVEALSSRMDELGVSRSQLALALSTSPAYITKVLRGESNFTIRSMVKLARAVRSVVRVHLAPIGASTRWIDSLNGALPQHAAANSTSADVSMDFSENGRSTRIRSENTTLARSASGRA